MMYYSRISGTGSTFPERVMANSEFEKFIDTSDEWIRTRTGIETRRIADGTKGETTMSLALSASRKAIEMAGLKATDIDLIIVGTVSPDTVMPCTANQVQAGLGASKAFSFDLQAACSGWLYGLSIADQYIRTGALQNVLVIGAETLSTLTNWKDRGTCVLFGDGAGAVVLTRSQDESHRILATRLYSDGTYGRILEIPHGYSKVPPHSVDYKADLAKIRMQGSELFKIAVRSMIDASSTLLFDHQLSVKDVDFFIFHQANIRIIESCIKTLGVDPRKTWINVNKYGNTSAATLPVCLDEAWKAGAVQPGNLILMTTFGGGLTWGSALVRL